MTFRFHQNAKVELTKIENTTEFLVKLPETMKRSMKLMDDFTGKNKEKIRETLSDVK